MDSYLNTALMNFKGDIWRVADAIEGTQIFGGTGAGKTSSSGKDIALSFLKNGLGGLILTYSAEDIELWTRYARQENREADLIIFGEGREERFDFLQYEASLKGGETENIVQLFMTVMEIAQRGKGRNSSDSYWEDTAKQLLRNAIDLLKFAGEEVSLNNINKLVLTAPKSEEEVLDVKSSAKKDLETSSYLAKCIAIADSNYTKQQDTESETSLRDWEIVTNFWYKFFPNLEEKTRSIIVSTFTSMADLLLRGLLGELFSKRVDFVPEDCFDGKLIILDLPYSKYLYVGQLAQVLFKYLWQRAVSARDIAQDPLPVFLWADESQYFLTSYDAEFQTTARHARVATVYLTQNISNYYAMLGADERAKAFVHSLLGNLQTKIFHQNSDYVTNEFASKLFGRRWKKHINPSTSSNSVANPANKHNSGTSSSIQESFDWSVPPHWFATLRKGSDKNDYKVDAYIFQGGRIWQDTGDIEIRVTFSQKS